MELLQILATLTTADADWAAYMGHNAMLFPLARILLHRDQIALALLPTNTEPKDDVNPFSSGEEPREDAASGEPTVVTGQDLLCLVLALLTTGSLQKQEMLQSIATTSELPGAYRSGEAGADQQRFRPHAPVSLRAFPHAPAPHK